MKTERFRLKYREFLSILRGEYRNIFTDGGVLLVVVGALLIYTTVYALAYRNEVLRDIPVAVIDQNHTAASRQLVRSFDATPNLRIAYKATDLKEAQELFMQRKINGIIVIPSDYEKKLNRMEQVNVVIYADASYFLMYRQVFFDVMGSITTSGSAIEFQRLTQQGVGSQVAEAVTNPVTISVQNMYNPYGGYATFIMPAIIILIIQQTLLIGIGMVGGTWREQGLYRKLIPVGEKRLAVLPIVLGKTAAYFSVNVVTLTYVLGFHYTLFGYPMNGAASRIILFLLPYLLSTIFLGIALSTLFSRRENSLMFMLFTSIPFLMLSGASLPVESMPHWLYTLGKVVPSSSGVDGFIRIQTMGATLSEVMTPFRTLWILTGVYFLLACGGIYRIIRKVSSELPESTAKNLSH